jgi:hypothetical protein
MTLCHPTPSAAQSMVDGGGQEGQPGFENKSHGKYQYKEKT